MPSLNISNSSAVQPRLARRQPKRRGFSILRIAGRLAGIFIVLVVCGVGYTLWASGQISAALARVETSFVALSASAGFRVADIEVVGRLQTDSQALLGAIGLKRNDAIFGFSPQDARQRIEALPWVASAAIERRLPDTVAITIVERRPIALWRHNERISLIDADGVDLGEVAIESAPYLPLVVGGDAPTHTAELLGILDQHPDIAGHVQASSWIGGRRWNLKLDSGIDVLLPEQGLAEAMQKLAEAQASTHVTERDVVAIDLRLPGKMVVRLGHEPLPPVKAKPQRGI